METNLATTNLLLGIMAATSVLEILLLIGAGIGMVMTFRRVQRAYLRVMALAAAGQRHVAPTLARVNAILDDVKDVTADVKDVTATVKEETDLLDTAIRRTVRRVDQTAGVVRGVVFAKASRLLGFVRGARMLISAILHEAR